MLGSIRRTVANRKTTMVHLDSITKMITQMDELKEQGLEPKYLVVGWKDYIELMKYASQEMNRPHVLREFMGCQLVVVRGCDIFQVVPDIIDLVGFRSS